MNASVYIYETFILCENSSIIMTYKLLTYTSVMFITTIFVVFHRK